MDRLSKRKKKRQKRSYKRIVTENSVKRMNPENIKAYDEYLVSSISKNPDMEDTTYKVYKSYMYQFFVYLTEEQENICILDDIFFENTVDIMDGFIMFCQRKLGNNKKVINTKLSAVSSYFQWAVRRGDLEYNPLKDKITRMKNAKDEKIIDSHFLNSEEIELVTNTLLDEYKKPKEERKYDIQHVLIWLIALDSGCRLGALQRLDLDSLDLESMMFEEIREKGAKITEVAFDPLTKEVIDEWIEMRDENLDGLECDGFFIAHHKGEWKPMSSHSIYNRVKKIGKIVGLDTFRPHSIRKTAINKIVDETGDIDLAREFANHEDISTTSKFYTKPKSKAEIREKINKLRKSKSKED